METVGLLTTTAPPPEKESLALTLSTPKRPIKDNLSLTGKEPIKSKFCPSKYALPFIAPAGTVVDLKPNSPNLKYPPSIPKYSLN